MTRPRALIEDWLPIRAVSVESQRERGASSALPPLYFLHVWWARRPLTASRAAVLGSVLPAWSAEWPDDLLRICPTEKDYREWFVRLLGIRGDPVAARKRILAANEKRIKLKKAYDGPRAFTVGPDTEQIEDLRRLLAYRWGTEVPTLLDPTAGGGSIPFESVRFGLPTKANELNPVASFILEATLTTARPFRPRPSRRYRQVGQSVGGARGETSGSLLPPPPRRVNPRVSVCPDCHLSRNRQAGTPQPQLVATQGREPGGDQANRHTAP